MQERATPPTTDIGIDYRQFAPLFLHAMLVQAIVTMVRVTTSYRAVELGLSGFWLGVIAGAFAILPVFLAVRIGRFVDGGNDARAAWIGSVLFLAACWGLRQSQGSIASLVGFTALFGVGHLFLMVAHQMLTVRAATEASREAAFGNYMVATAAGQGLGPFIVGVTGGSAQVPPTQSLFALAVLMALLTLVISAFIRPAAKGSSHHAKAALMPVPELLRLPALPTLLLASVITVTAQDLIVIYLPVLGAERGIDAGNVGMLLTLRSITAVVARLFYAPLIRAVGRVPLTVVSMVASSLAYVLIAMSLPLFVLYACVVVIGLGLGIAATLSISNVVDRVPISARAVALSLRITGNRIGQVAFPFLAGVVASASGAAGIFWVVAGTLIYSGLSVHMVCKANPPVSSGKAG